MCRWVYVTANACALNCRVWEVYSGWTWLGWCCRMVLCGHVSRTRRTSDCIERTTSSCIWETHKVKLVTETQVMVCMPYLTDVCLLLVASGGSEELCYIVGTNCLRAATIHWFFSYWIVNILRIHLCHTSMSSLSTELPLLRLWTEWQAVVSTTSRRGGCDFVEKLLLHANNYLFKLVWERYRELVILYASLLLSLWMADS